MPKRFITYSRSEPARTILFSVSILTGVVQTIAFILGGFALPALPNLVLVLGLCGWGTWASVRNNMRHMSMSSFWLFIAWLWSGVTRLIVVAHDPTQMLWAPMLIIAVILSVVYLYLSHARKAGTSE